jgi:hypothetical protein
MVEIGLRFYLVSRCLKDRARPTKHLRQRQPELVDDAIKDFFTRLV